jgi:hypothetical protein
MDPFSAVAAVGTFAGGIGSLTNAFKQNNNTGNSSNNSFSDADWYNATVAAAMGAQNSELTARTGEGNLALGGYIGALGLEGKTTAELQKKYGEFPVTAADYATQTEATNAGNIANAALNLGANAANLKNKAESNVSDISVGNASDYSKAVSELAKSGQEGINTISNTAVTQTGNIGAQHDTNLASLNTAGINAASTVANQGVAQTGTLQGKILDTEGTIAANNAATLNKSAQNALDVSNQYAAAVGATGLKAQLMGLEHEYNLQKISANTKQAQDIFKSRQHELAQGVLSAHSYYS